MFGRQPVGLEQLENPALYPDGDGQEFLKEQKQRMLHLHKVLRTVSDEIKAARTAEVTSREYDRLHTARKGVVQPSTPGQDRYVWLLYGSKENAAYIRKHGHGSPWRHRYKVLEVKPHAVRLEVPKDRSVPMVQEWQPLRRVCVARPDQHAPDGTEPTLTDSGLAVSPDDVRPIVFDGDLDDDNDDDNDIWNIERVVRAEKVGGKYVIWLKWKGSDELSSRLGHELMAESSNPDLIKEIREAIAAARAIPGPFGHVDDEDDVPEVTVPPNLVSPPASVLPSEDDPTDLRPIAQRKEKRRTAARMLLLHDAGARLEAFAELNRFQLLADDYCFPFDKCPSLPHLLVT